MLPQKFGRLSEQDILKLLNELSVENFSKKVGRLSITAYLLYTFFGVLIGFKFQIIVLFILTLLLIFFVTKIRNEITKNIEELKSVYSLIDEEELAKFFGSNIKEKLDLTFVLTDLILTGEIIWIIVISLMVIPMIFAGLTVLALSINTHSVLLDFLLMIITIVTSIIVIEGSIEYIIASILKEKLKKFEEGKLKINL